MRRLVAPWGHCVCEAGDRVGVLKVAVSTPWAVALVAVELLAPGGYALGRWLRRRARVRDALVVPLIGASDMLHFLEAGAAGFPARLFKPCSEDLLRLLTAAAADRGRAAP